MGKRMITKSIRQHIIALHEYIHPARHVAVLSGAGISVPSGIPDFRSAGGIYTTGTSQNVFDLSRFHCHPEDYYTFAADFYALTAKAKPNAAHRLVDVWQKCGKIVDVATQNIDDLHERAGAHAVYHVHGTMHTHTCLACGKTYDFPTIQAMMAQSLVPRCSCQGLIKPDVTFFGESLPEMDWLRSVVAMKKADVIVVMGTSLQVYPAATLPMNRSRHTQLVIINRDPTPLDEEADLVIHDDLATFAQHYTEMGAHADETSSQPTVDRPRRPVGLPENDVYR